jgi:sRNA-binding regulator protein Hfq
MPGTFSANGTWGLRMIETGSLTPTSNQAIPSYIRFFDQLQQSRQGGINTTYELATEFNLNSVPAGNYYFQILQSPNFATGSLPLVTLDPLSTTKSFLEIRQVNSAADGRVMDIPSNMPFATTGIKQIDFIIGLQRKFHLVIYPDKTKPNQFIIETFNNWYKNGKVKSFDNYIDLNEKWDVVPANNLAVNKLNFGDTLDGDYISQQFAKGANREYAKQYYTDTTNFYSQGTFEVKTTFASSPLLRITGTGLSGSVGGIVGPITQYSAGTWQFTSGGARTACSSPIRIQIYTANGDITTGQVAYVDQYGVTPLTGYTFYSNGTIIYKINSSTGVLESGVSLCGR